MVNEISEFDATNDATKFKPVLNDQNVDLFVERTTKFEDEQEFRNKLNTNEIKVVSHLTKSLQPNKEYVFDKVMEKAYCSSQLVHKRM